MYGYLFIYIKQCITYGYLFILNNFYSLKLATIFFLQSQDNVGNIYFLR